MTMGVSESLAMTNPLVKSPAVSPYRVKSYGRHHLDRARIALVPVASIRF